MLDTKQKWFCKQLFYMVDFVFDDTKVTRVISISHVVLIKKGHCIMKSIMTSDGVISLISILSTP